MKTLRLSALILIIILTLGLGPCRTNQEADQLISPQPTPEATPIEDPSECRCFQMPDGRIICNSACSGKE
jgi:hypothetical protein